MNRNSNVVLLFFKDFERDSILPGDRHIKRVLRPLYNRVRKTQAISGFAVWCRLLKRALEEQGYTVHLNNYKLAFDNPHYPVGLVGYPALLEGWSLPNPAILGPALLDHPSQDPTLMQDPRFEKYVVTCDWMYDQFAPVFGESKTMRWYAGMDLEKWPDRRSEEKTLDVLIYDKIRWQRERYEPAMLEPIKAYLDQKGLTHETIRYKHYVHDMYRDQLKRAKSMIFLCEHETQGMAYQEALSSNVPIMAWDQGEWLDPNRPKYSSTPIAACSVPYFDDALCGSRFVSFGDFGESFENFWSKLDTYEPRDYVKQALSFKGSAEIYAAAYFAQLRKPAATTDRGQNNAPAGRRKRAILR